MRVSACVRFQTHSCTLPQTRLRGRWEGRGARWRAAGAAIVVGPPEGRCRQMAGRCLQSCPDCRSGRGVSRPWKGSCYPLARGRLLGPANRYPRGSSVTPGTDRSSDRAGHVTISARDDGVPSSRADNASESKGDEIILMKFSMVYSVGTQRRFAISRYTSDQQWTMTQIEITQGTV